LALHVQSQERCKALLEELTAKSQLSTEEAKVAAFYAAAMDEEAIEQAGVMPMKPLLDAIDEIVTTYQKKDQTEYATLIGKLASTHGTFRLFRLHCKLACCRQTIHVSHANTYLSIHQSIFFVHIGIYAFMGTGASPDYKDSDHSLCQISQGGIGLPDRDYYFDEDKQEKRDAYKKHVAMMLTLLENPAATEETEEATAQALKIFDLEVQLADAHMTRTENRDPKATYNKMPVADLNARGKDGFAFDAYLLGSTGKAGERLGEVNVRNTLALERVALVASTVDPEILTSYLRWHAVSSCAPYLSKVFVAENFGFFEKTLSGTEEMKPRWKRAMAFTEAALGEQLGQLYCDKHFDEECKVRAHAVVESVRAALEERLNEVDWIKTDSTRLEALKKMSSFRIKIGYPDQWIDYSTLVMGEKDDFLAMVFKSRVFDHDRESKEMNSATDREKWVSSM
jgi:putative endopeptidase